MSMFQTLISFTLHISSYNGIAKSYYCVLKTIHFVIISQLLIIKCMSRKYSSSELRFFTLVLLGLQGLSTHLIILVL